MINTMKLIKIDLLNMHNVIFTFYTGFEIFGVLHIV